MSLFNDIDWTKNTPKNVFRILQKVKNYAKRFPLVHRSILGPGEEDKSYGTHNDKPEGTCNMTVDVMVENVKESGHPKVRGIGALNRGFLKRKGGRCTTNFNAESSNAELLFRTIHSAIQPNIGVKN